MSSSESEDDEEFDLDQVAAEVTEQEERDDATAEKESLVPAIDMDQKVGLPGAVTGPGMGSGGVVDVAGAEKMIAESGNGKYAAATTDEKGGLLPTSGEPSPRSGNPNLLRAKSVYNRRRSIHGAELAASSTAAGWQKLLKQNVPGGVKLQAQDHKNIVVSYWEFNQDILMAATPNHPDSAESSTSRGKPGATDIGTGGIPVANLKPFLDSAVQKSLDEQGNAQAAFDKLSAKDRKKFKRAGAWPKTETCRWFHLPGCSHEAVDYFVQSYRLDQGVANACKDVSGKPICSWHQNEDSTYDHLFVAAHYIQKAGEKPVPEATEAEATGCCGGDGEDGSPPEDDGIAGFMYQQVFMVFYPTLNTIISIDANGEKTWDGVTDLLQNECGFVRVNEDCSVLIYKLLDSMIDEVYPLLDLYGDLLESLEFETMAADEPTDTHVRTSFKLKRRVHSLRRYAWSMRQLLQELRQNNFGVISKETIKMMTSVERNAENMVEVACAYMEQCTGIESFYDSFQEKVQGSTLYILTISSVTIMPFQLLTGLFGMNFTDPDGDGPENEQVSHEE